MMRARARGAEDPQKREQFVTRWRPSRRLSPPTGHGRDGAAPPAAATTAPAPPAAPPPAPPADRVPLAPDSLGAEVLVGASGFLNRMSDAVTSAIGAVRSAPQLLVWLEIMATDPWPRSVLLDAAWRLVLVMR